MQQLKEKFNQVKQRAEDNNSRVIRAEERFATSKKRVEEVVKEIKGSGYDDPKKLPEIKEAKIKKFEADIKELTVILDKQEEILARMED